MLSEESFIEFLDTLTERQVEDLLSSYEQATKAVREYVKRKLVDHPSNPNYKEYF